MGRVRLANARSCIDKFNFAYPSCVKKKVGYSPFVALFTILRYKIPLKWDS
jgi:hypothetical protein